MAPTLDDLWLQPFEDLGPLRDERGQIIYGSDPEIEFADGRVHLFHTFGPVPGRPRGPATFYRTRLWDGGELVEPKSLLRDWSDAEIVIEPRWEHEERGVETISIDWWPQAARWFGHVTAYKARKRESRLVPISAKKLSGPWTRHDEHSIWPQMEWEQGQFADQGICYSHAYAALIVAYAAKSEPPDTRWRVGMMASVDGVHWNRPLEPFAVPPKSFEDERGINAHSQVAIVEDPRYPGILRCVTTESGRVSVEHKGLIEWIWMEGRWHKGPRFLIRPVDMKEPLDGRGHVGAPSLWYDHDAKRWMAVVTAFYKPPDGVGKIRNHVRLITQKAPS